MARRCLLLTRPRCATRPGAAPLAASDIGSIDEERGPEGDLLGLAAVLTRGLRLVMPSLFFPRRGGRCPSPGAPSRSRGYPRGWCGWRRPRAPLVCVAAIEALGLARRGARCGLGPPFDGPIPRYSKGTWAGASRQHAVRPNPNHGHAVLRSQRFRRPSWRGFHRLQRRTPRKVQEFESFLVRNLQRLRLLGDVAPGPRRFRPLITANGVKTG